MNNPKEFLEILADELRYLPAKEVNEVLKHYNDKINNEVDYGTPVDKVLASLKSPEEIAQNIYKMHGVDYLKKRKTKAKIKDTLIAILSGLLIIACLLIFVVGTIFIGNIIINQISLVIYAFNFNQILDTILTTIFVVSYCLVNLIAYIYIVDLFIILINSLLQKILNAFEKTRGKYYSFMDFTITAFFNKITKKNKFLLKSLGICAIVFVVFAIASYATSGYMYRAFNDKNNHKLEIEYDEDILNEIKVNATKSNVTIIKDDTITKPIIEILYELFEPTHQIENNSVTINIPKHKTYDLLGFIKNPTSSVIIKVPSNYQTNSINAEVQYGNFEIKDVNSIKNIDISTTSGSIKVVGNKIEKLSIELYSGDIYSNKNNIQEYIINHKSGNLQAGEDIVDKLIHTNGSSQVIMGDSNIDDYELTNTSGTLIIERIIGMKFKMISNTSINQLCDLYFEESEITVQNTARLELTRSYFESLTVKAIYNSYQLLEYVKAPILNVSSDSGSIICTDINTNYTQDEIKKEIELYTSIKDNQVNDKLTKEELTNLLKTYNNYDLTSSKINIKAKKANLTINEMNADEIILEQSEAASEIYGVKATKSTLTFVDTASTINEYYGEVVDININSTNYTSRSDIEFYNQAKTPLVVNVVQKYNEFFYDETKGNFTVNK